MAQTPPNVLAFIGLQPTGDFGFWTIYTTKRRGIVWFAKSPPKKAPSYKQLHQRDRFRSAATSWRKLTPAARAAWATACARARLQLSGYCLFVYFQLTRDQATIETIQRQSGITLIA